MCILCVLTGEISVMYVMCVLTDELSVMCVNRWVKCTVHHVWVDRWDRWAVNKLCVFSETSWTSEMYGWPVRLKGSLNQVYIDTCEIGVVWGVFAFSGEIGAVEIPVMTKTAQQPTLNYDLFIFFKKLFTTVLFQWDFFHGIFGLPCLGKASCNRVVLPMLSVLVFL